jgi:integrase
MDGVASEGATKSHQRRDVALDDALLGLLTKRRADQETYAAVVDTTLVADPFILSPVATGGRPFVPDTLTDYYKRTANQLGIATHFHELRHFAATMAIGAGTDVRTVAGRLGHADASVTLRVYAHALEARDRDMAQVLSSAVLGTSAHGGDEGSHGPERHGVRDCHTLGAVLANNDLDGGIGAGSEPLGHLDP